MTSLTIPLSGASRLAITTELDGDSVVIRLVGEMDVLTETAISSSLSRVVAGTGVNSLQVDVTGVSFIDSYGLRSLILARETALQHEVGFTLHRTPLSVVGKRLRLTGLDGLFDNRG